MIMEILDCSDVGLCRQVEWGLEARLRKKHSYYLCSHSSHTKSLFRMFWKENSFITPSTVMIKAGKWKWEKMGRFRYFEYLVAKDAGQDGDVVRLVEHIISRFVPLIEEFKQKLSPLLWSQSILWCCDVSLFISVRCSHVANDLSSVRVPELLPATITITITRGFFGLVITIKNKKRSEVSWREG